MHTSDRGRFISTSMGTNPVSGMVVDQMEDQLSTMVVYFLIEPDGMQVKLAQRHTIFRLSVRIFCLPSCQALRDE